MLRSCNYPHKCLDITIEHWCCAHRGGALKMFVWGYQQAENISERKLPVERKQHLHTAMQIKSHSVRKQLILLTATEIWAPTRRLHKFSHIFGFIAQHGISGEYMTVIKLNGFKKWPWWTLAPPSRRKICAIYRKNETWKPRIPHWPHRNWAEC